MRLDPDFAMAHSYLGVEYYKRTAKFAYFDEAMRKLKDAEEGLGEVDQIVQLLLEAIADRFRALGRAATLGVVGRSHVGADEEMARVRRGHRAKKIARSFHSGVLPAL